MPGLIRGIARTAVIAGTATSVSNRVSRRQGERWAREAQAQQPPPQQNQAAPPPPPAGGTDRISALKELAALHAQGVLTDDEFAQEKARILAS